MSEREKKFYGDLARLQQAYDQAVEDRDYVKQADLTREMEELETKHYREMM